MGNQKKEVIMTLIKMQDFLNRSIGWDGLFQDLVHRNTSNFPPYSISREGNDYDIEVALAGYSRDNIDITVQDGVLSISSKGVDKSEEVCYTYKGIANRSFLTKFAIGKYHEVQDASMENGMLTIRVTEVLPEEKLVKHITVS